MSASEADWGNFFLAAASAAAALTGLLFVAVSLRPREIRQSALMAGRARSAFYAFVTVLLVGLLELVPRHPTLVGAGQLAVAVSVMTLSFPFSRAAARTHQIRYARASVYHGGLLCVAVAGALRTMEITWRDTTTLLAAGVLLLVGVAVSNAWQLVLSHEAVEP